MAPAAITPNERNDSRIGGVRVRSAEPSRPARSSRPGRPARSALFGVAVLLGATATALLTGCGGATRPDGIADAATEQVAATTPDWFPAGFPAPRGGVIVSVVAEPDTGNDKIRFGRSVTWRVDRPYDDVLRDLDATLRSLSWTPTERLATTGEQDSRRTSIYIENGTVEVIRVFTDTNLKGTRVTVELPD